MHITIIASGSRGDVQPYVALGKGLQGAGHHVTIVTSDDFQSLVTSYGLTCVTTGGHTEAVAQEMQSLVEQGNLLKILARTGRGAKQLAYQAAISGLTACQGADLIIGGLGGLSVGLALSEKLGIPFLQAYLIPWTPTRAFPSAVLPLPQTSLTTWANGLSHRLTQQMMWQMLRPADHSARTHALQLAPTSFWGPFATLERHASPILYGYSPHVVPPPKDWDKHIHVTGYWLLEPPADWQPPRELLDFLHAGPPPVYIGFGSMPSSNPEATADLVVEALTRAGQRGILSTGWGGLQQAQLPETMFMVGSTPHTWLFPQMAAIVHHGGAGTTAASLWAGRPTIVIPFFGDQPFWGRRVYDLGVGPRPIPRRQLTVDTLTNALRCTLSDVSMQQRAAALGTRIRAEDGVARAVAVIEHYR